ncbi:site-specific integrase [Spongiibacter sp. KMU-166]|uniref:Site-specific integrase n=1 Tax=Spongiibacter thalassae TaxID=2721624 RepID=A0ABX1GC44_9GAMM|nr:DUF3596 domain-containing protein [Spongiibacter thalassae]NKI16742.1 site-specific integrase [Spongiibacter thalassae]
MAKISVRKETQTLLFDFNYLGKRCREQTTLKDTKANRRKMEKVLERIELEIIAGTFDYGKFFPGSSRAKVFAANGNPGASQTAPATPPITEVVVNTAPSVATTKAVTPISPEPSSPTFAEFAAIWLGENEAVWRRNTIRAASIHLNSYLLPYFADMPLYSVNKAHCLDFRAKIAREGGSLKGKTLSAKTVNEVMQVLGAIMAEAAERYDFANPMQNVKRLKARKVHIEPFTFEEVQLFLKHVRPDYHSYFTVRFFTGLRTGEVHGLRWPHIDFDRREILVRETFSHLGREYTKNEGSQREVKMSEPVYRALKAQHEASGHFSDYVFCSKVGTPIQPLNVNRRIWKPTLKRLGLKDRRLYQTRHTAATLWLASGEAPEWIARQMGHTSTEMLFKVYSRYVPNLTRKDGSAFERLLEQRLGGGA